MSISKEFNGVCVILFVITAFTFNLWAVPAGAPSGGKASNMYNTGAEGDITSQMNLMWATFGRGENVRLTLFGNEPGWYEWMARKHCWSDTPEYREMLHRYLVDWPQSNDGYIWTWGNEEGWPTHHVRHNENNAKYILAGCKYYCWQGGYAFLEAVESTTTTPLAFNERR